MQAAGPGTRHLLRRLVGGPPGRFAARYVDTYLTWGRAAGPGGGEKAGLDARPGCGRGPGAAVRHPAARDHPGHRAGRPWAVAGRAARPAGPGGDREARSRSSAAPSRPARTGCTRCTRRTGNSGVARDLGGLPAPVGRGSGLVARAARAPRWSASHAQGGRPDRGVRGAGHLGVHPVPGTRTWRRAYWFGDGRAGPSCAGAGAGRRRRHLTCGFGGYSTRNRKQIGGGRRELEESGACPPERQA